MEVPVPYNSGSPDSIYLDYQASTPLDPEVFEAMHPWFLDHYGNPHSNEHAYGWRAQSAIENARAQISELIGVDRDGIVFTSGATESNNLVLFGVARHATCPRDTILVSSIEHASVLAPARQLEAQGFRVIEIPVDHDGFISKDALRDLLSDRVLLVSVGVVNNEIGVVQELETIGECCRRVGALFHSDAAQALTAIDLCLGEIPVDFASLASHKAYGPKGIGALYVAPGVANTLAPLLVGGGQQGGLRAGTLPTPLCVGLGEACAKLLLVGAANRKKTTQLRDELLSLLRTRLPNLVVNGSVTRRHPGNLNVRLAGADARDAIQRLQPQVACSTGSACQSGAEEPSHVLRAIGLSTAEAWSSLRLSVSHLTQQQHLAHASGLIARALTESMSRVIDGGGLRSAAATHASPLGRAATGVR